MERTDASSGDKHYLASDRRAPDAALDLCQRQWRAAFGNPVIGFGLYDLDRRLLDGNQALERLVGRSIGELRVAPTPVATHPDDREANLAIFRAIATGQQERGDYTKRYVHRDGTVIWCHVQLALVRHPADEPHEIVMMVVDTPRRCAPSRRCKRNCSASPGWRWRFFRSSPNLT